MFLGIWNRTKGVEINQKERRAEQIPSESPGLVLTAKPQEGTVRTGSLTRLLRASLEKVWGQPYAALRSLSFHKVREKTPQGAIVSGMGGGFPP